jgi:hypothetical protein
MANPEEIQIIFQILMNFNNIKESYEMINDSLIGNGISIQLLLKELNSILIDYDMPDRMKVFNNTIQFYRCSWLKKWQK